MHTHLGMLSHVCVESLHSIITVALEGGNNSLALTNRLLAFLPDTHVKGKRGRVRGEG